MKPKTKSYKFENVKLREGHFIRSGLTGMTICEITLQIVEPSVQKIHKLMEWMKLNQLDYIFNIDQNFDKDVVKVDFYKTSGIVGKN